MKLSFQNNVTHPLHLVNMPVYESAMTAMTYLPFFFWSFLTSFKRRKVQLRSNNTLSLKLSAPRLSLLVGPRLPLDPILFPRLQHRQQ